MSLNRNFDLEQRTGECSYCGYQLPVIEVYDGQLIFDTCPFCDAYEEDQAVEALLFDLESDSEDRR